MAKPRVSAAMHRAIAIRRLSKPKNSKRTTWDGPLYGGSVSDRTVTTLVMLNYFKPLTSGDAEWHQYGHKLDPDRDYLIATVDSYDVEVERSQKTCCPACGNVFQWEEGRAALKGRKP